MKLCKLLSVAILVIWGNVRASDLMDAGRIGNQYDTMLKSGHCNGLDSEIVIKQKAKPSYIQIQQGLKFLDRVFVINGQTYDLNSEDFTFDFTTGELKFVYNGTSTAQSKIACFVNHNNAARCLGYMPAINQLIFDMAGRIVDQSDEDDKKFQAKAVRCVQDIVYVFSNAVQDYYDKTKPAYQVLKKTKGKKH